MRRQWHIEYRHDGAVTVVVALVAVLLVGMAALGLDVPRTLATQQQLQSSLDAAVLAAAQEADLAVGQQVADQFFQANFNGFFGAEVTAPPTLTDNGDGTVTLAATVTLPTPFGGVWGRPHSVIPGRATAQLGAPIELAIALDTSHHMTQLPAAADAPSRLAAVQAGAASLLSGVFGNSASLPGSSFSIVPYADAVRIADPSKAESWGTRVGVAGHPTLSYDGCIADRKNDLTDYTHIDPGDVIDAAPSPGDRFPPYAGPFLSWGHLDTGEWEKYKPKGGGTLSFVTAFFKGYDGVEYTMYNYAAAPSTYPNNWFRYAAFFHDTPTDSHFVASLFRLQTGTADPNGTFVSSSANGRSTLDGLFQNYWFGSLTCTAGASCPGLVYASAAPREELRLSFGGPYYGRIRIALGGLAPGQNEAGALDVFDAAGHAVGASKVLSEATASGSEPAAAPGCWPNCSYELSVDYKLFDPAPDGFPITGIRLFPIDSGERVSALPCPLLTPSGAATAHPMYMDDTLPSGCRFLGSDQTPPRINNPSYYVPDNSDFVPQVRFYPSCRVSPILTASQLTTLQAHLAGLVTGGPARPNVGMQWAWYALSPNWRGHIAAAPFPKDHAPSNRKAAILVASAPHLLQYSPSYDLEALALQCAAMKAQGISIYTVRYDYDTNPATNPRGNQVLESCASVPAQAVIATSRTDLEGKMRLIGEELRGSSVRLVQ